MINKVYRGTCGSCGCYVECTRGELLLIERFETSESMSIQLFDWTARCPECTHNIYFNKKA